MSRRRRVAAVSSGLLVSWIVAATVYQRVFDCGLGRPLAALVDLHYLGEALWVFEAEVGRYPTEKEGLTVLEPLLKRPLRKDPWGNPYVYILSSIPEPSVVSYGADGASGGSGDAADLSSIR